MICPYASLHSLSPYAFFTSFRLPVFRADYSLIREFEDDIYICDECFKCPPGSEEAVIPVSPEPAQSTSFEENMFKLKPI